MTYSEETRVLTIGKRKGDFEGLIDDVCPPRINFAAYNQVKSEKQYIVYPLSGHGLPQDFHIHKMDWIRSHFGLK